MLEQLLKPSAMNQLHRHRLTNGGLTLRRHALTGALLPPDQINEHHQVSSQSSSTAHDSLLKHFDQKLKIPDTLFDTVIFESQNDVEENNDETDFHNSVSSLWTCKLHSCNFTTLSSRPATSKQQLNSNKATIEQVNATYPFIFPANTAGCMTISQTPTITSGRCPFCLDDKSDYVRNFRSTEQQHRSRTISSWARLRSNFVRKSDTRNIMRKDIVFGSVIGKGGFGKVYAGQIHGQSVAVKVVQKRRGSGIHREILQAERLAFSLNLKHDNIVCILGLNLCDGLRGDAFIVMELVSPQTLQSVLDDHTRSVTQSQRLQFALQITLALGYLHDNDVAHLDVKPRNVLMTSDNKCKLADFGSLTRTRKDGPREDTEFTQLLGTLPYRAPELMKGCYPTSKADIFSLGITFWQLATREAPHNGANPHWLIYQVTKSNRRPDHHDAGGNTVEVKYRELYSACWDAEPKLRPNAGGIIVSLNDMLQRVWEGTWSDAAKRNE
uniref:non-specific serine/threonine protein kinase n=1 Tax=Arion vulgaris TaxID=1028688 RepID=A0A0B7A9R3_9EUPU